MQPQRNGEWASLKRPRVKRTADRERGEREGEGEREKVIIIWIKYLINNITKTITYQRMIWQIEICQKKSKFIQCLNSWLIFEL